MYKLGYAVVIWCIDNLICFVSRSLINKTFFRYNDLQPGQVVEVKKSHTVFISFCAPTKM